MASSATPPTFYMPALASHLKYHVAAGRSHFQSVFLVNVNAILEMSAVPEVEGFVALPGRFTDLTTDTLLIVPESFREALEGLDQVVNAAKVALDALQKDDSKTASSTSSISTSSSSSSASAQDKSTAKKEKDSKPVDPFAIQAKFTLDSSFDVSMMELTSLVVLGQPSASVIAKYNKALGKFNTKKVLDFVYAE